MLRTTARPVLPLLAACLLGGCSIEITTGDGARQPGQPPPPPPPAAQAKGQAAAPNAQRPAQRPAVAPGRQHPPVPSTATRLTSPNAFGNGKGGAFQGLAYVIPETSTKIPASVLVPFAALYTDRFAIQPQEFTSGFPGAMMQNEWFLIRYEGAFNVPSQGKWQFRVISDDGAKLYVDDKLVVDNDGLHTAKQADGEATLTPGRHWLRLDYFQGPRGPVALSVLSGQNGKLSPLVGVR